MKFTYPPESTPLPGFTIKRAIHRGGFGEVYYGLSDAGKEVALKLLHQHSEIELRGATACLNLNHPNLVTIYDIRTDADGDSWIVMEYVGGTRLCDLLEQRGKLPVEEIERWLDGLAGGLAFLHDRGIVHRDLKPSNVFSEAGLVKVGDVGLSKFITESRRSAHTQSVGTVYYMAPEVARGRYGREVDVYALGVMLYEMLTGDVPFDGESTGEILMKHLTAAPDLGRLPERLRPVIARSLEKDPAKRTPTVTRLRDEFKAAVRGRAVEPRDQAVELPDAAFFDRRDRPAPERPRRDAAGYAAAAADAASAGDLDAAARYGREAREAAARGYAEGARRIGGADPCAPRGSCGSRRREARRAAAPMHAVAGSPAASDSGMKWVWVAIAAFVLFGLFTPPGRRVMPSLWELTIFAALGYGVYAVVRSMTGGHRPIPAPVVTPPPPVTAPVPPSAPSPTFAAAHASLPVIQPVARRTVQPPRRREISMRQRLSELTGSMAVAAVATAAITAALAAFGLADPQQAVFFGGTGILASWGLLTAAKLTEGTNADATARRAVNAVAGLAVGAAAYGLDQFLFADFLLAGFGDRPGDHRIGAFDRVGALPLVEADGGPSLFGYLFFFAALFAVRGWWRQSDAWRPKRLKVTAALLTGLLAFAVVTVVSFPPTWAVLWAVVASCVLQLAAAWTPPAERPWNRAAA